MAWKKKEKPLTPEEAIALAKKELAPFWFNSEPLLAAVRTEQGASVLPLNSHFVQQPWLYAFVDPTEFAGERALQIIREWYRRYSAHRLGFIIVFRAPDAFARTAPDLLRKFQIQFPAMIDQDNLYASAFGITSWPAVVVQNGSQEITRGSGAGWNEESEEVLQVFLRKSDPGLSLPLPYVMENPVTGHSRTDFGSKKGKPIASLKSVIQLEGNWKESDDCISTADPSAVAIIQSPSAIVSLIAQAGIESQLTKIMVQPSDGAMLEDWLSESTTMDENGNGIAKIQHFGFYSILKDLPPNRRSFRLTFPDADTVPVQIFGLRFGAKA